jgi:hypothetical protein
MFGPGTLKLKLNGPAVTTAAFAQNGAAKVAVKSHIPVKECGSIALIR